MELQGNKAKEANKLIKYKGEIVMLKMKKHENCIDGVLVKNLDGLKGFLEEISSKRVYLSHVEGGFFLSTSRLGSSFSKAELEKLPSNVVLFCDEMTATAKSIMDGVVEREERCIYLVDRPKGEIVKLKFGKLLLCSFVYNEFLVSIPDRYPIDRLADLKFKRFKQMIQERIGGE